MSKVIEELLKEKIGLDVQSVGVTSVNNAIKRCFYSSKYDDVEQFYDALLSSEAEFRRLVETVVIPETWFFRDEIPFDVLIKSVSRNWLSQKNDTRVLRILSVPCSTGEEPYTIAMALDQIGFPAERVKIDAVDISQASLDKARKGVYRENSFRSEKLSFRDKYFIKVDEGYQLKKTIRERVDLSQGNLLRDDFSHKKEEYDVIFCRNLLIYFDSNDQQNTIRKLYSLLKKDGMLFVGHAEANSNINQLFQSLRLRGAFAFVKKYDGKNESGFDDYGDKFSKFSKKYSSLQSIRAEKKTFDSQRGPDSVSKPFASFIHPAKFKQECSEKALISKAQCLADEGSLDEAEQLCQEILLKFNSAGAFYLLGVVYEASDQYEKAESMFRKAIYLEPDHVEALVHLALHLERRGDDEEAVGLRRRADRAK